jgi:hypothetical protein
VARLCRAAAARGAFLARKGRRVPLGQGRAAGLLRRFRADRRGVAPAARPAARRAALGRDLWALGAGPPSGARSSRWRAGLACRPPVGDGYLSAHFHELFAWSPGSACRSAIAADAARRLMRGRRFGQRCAAISGRRCGAGSNCRSTTAGRRAIRSGSAADRGAVSPSGCGTRPVLAQGTAVKPATAWLAC